MWFYSTIDETLAVGICSASVTWAERKEYPMKTRSAVVACALVLAAAAAPVEAATVLVTDVPGTWKVSRFTSNGPGTYDGVSYTADAGVQNVSAVLVNPINAAWTAQNDPRLTGAKWISANANSGTGTIEPMFVKYVYQNSFSVAGLNTLDFTFAADNFVDTITLSANADGSSPFASWTNPTLPLGDLSTKGKIWGFELNQVQNLVSNGSGTIYLTATTYNFDTALNGIYNPGPNGFIMAVDAAPVPLPAAAWAGLSVLGGLGVARRLRRK